MKKILFMFLTTSTLCFATEGLNAKKADQRVVVDSPSSKNSRAPKFEGMDVSFLDVTSTDESIEAYRQKIEESNKGHDPKEIWKNLNWNIDFFNRENLPVVVGEITDKEAFSKNREGKGLRFLDLPIHMPQQGWRVPQELEQFKEIISKAAEHERILNPDFEKDRYVYITVDQGVVLPLKSQRRSGYHGDSYRKVNTKNKDVTIPVDHLYVIYDNCPTLFTKGPYPLNGIDAENGDAVSQRFAEIGKDQKPILYPAYTLLRMDPYCIHDAGINDTKKSMSRTFVKISISKVK